MRTLPLPLVDRAERPQAPQPENVVAQPVSLPPPAKNPTRQRRLPTYRSPPITIFCTWLVPS